MVERSKTGWVEARQSVLRGAWPQRQRHRESAQRKTKLIPLRQTRARGRSEPLDQLFCALRDALAIGKLRARHRVESSDCGIAARRRTTGLRRVPCASSDHRQELTGGSHCWIHLLKRWRKLVSKHGKFQSSRSGNFQVIERTVGIGVEEGVLWRTSSSSASRHVCVANHPFLNFGTCSYLGLHIRSELMNGAIDAIQRFGTQFSSSRVYNACNLYSELESGLEQMTGRSVAVAASTTLLHMAAIPVLVGDTDLVIIDQFAHASLHMAAELLGNTNVVRIRHSHMQKLELMIQEFADRHERIWYIADGLYSMRGDFAPFDELSVLLDRYPKLHVYLDDAHSTGWYGECGRGAALSHLPNTERVAVALSLAKSFSAAGGALAMATPELKEKNLPFWGNNVFFRPYPATDAGCRGCLGETTSFTRASYSSGESAQQDRIHS